jgi:dTDP-4-dehydrorhamnose reductase
MTRGTVLITGAGGLIGSHLLKSAAALVPNWQVTGLTRRNLDLTDAAALERTFERYQPCLVIHCAAISKSPACQADPALARKVNVEVTARLAALAMGIPFIFLSSDLVFDGRQGNYLETAHVNPLSIYGETKVEAEQIVLANPRHTVIRTSLNGGVSPTGDRGFNEEIRLAWREARTVSLFSDEFRCPIPACATARAIWELAMRNAVGIYHVAGSERLSRLQIGELLGERWPQLNPKIKATSLKEYQGAPRPPDVSLNSAKAQKLLSFHLPGLGAWLKANPKETF